MLFFRKLFLHTNAMRKIGQCFYKEAVPYDIYIWDIFGFNSPINLAIIMF